MNACHHLYACGFKFNVFNTLDKDMQCPCKETNILVSDVFVAK